jgi:hypothetical protein
MYPFYMNNLKYMIMFKYFKLFNKPLLLSSVVV